MKYVSSVVCVNLRAWCVDAISASPFFNFMTHTVAVYSVQRNSYSVPAGACDARCTSTHLAFLATRETT